MSELLPSVLIGESTSDLLLPVEHEMITNPSQLALERMERLSGYIHELNYDNVDTEDRYQIFLKNQPFDFFDKVATVLHGDEDEFKNFILVTADDRPHLVVKQPELFDSYLDPEKKQQLYRKAASDSRLSFHFGLIQAELNPADKQHFATRIIRSQSREVVCYALMTALKESDLPISEKKAIATNALDSQWMWNTYFSGTRNATERRDRDVFIDMISSIKSLVANGVLDPSVMEAKFQHRMHGELPTVSMSESQYRIEAANMHTLFKIYGVLPNNEKKSNSDLVMDLLDFTMQTKGGSGELYRFVPLIDEGFVDAKQILEAYGKYDNAHKTCYRDELEDRLVTNTYSDEKDVHVNDEELSEYYDKVMSGEIDFTDEEHYASDFVRIVLRYNGQNLEMARQLVELYGQKERLTLDYGYLARLESLFDGETDRLKAVMTVNMKLPSFKFDLANWQPFAQLMGMTKEDVRERVQMQLQSRSSVYGKINNLHEILKSKDPLFSLEECAISVQEIINNYQIGKTESMWIAKLCKGYLGSTLADKYITGLITLESNAASIKLITEAEDYYDIYNAVTYLPSAAHNLTAEQLNNFVTTAVQTLSDEHLIDSLWFLWDVMDDNQKEYAFSRIYLNPALTEMEFSQSYVQRYANELGHDRRISNTPYVDSLIELAPKAYATMRRQMGAKSLSETQQVGREQAQPFFPLSLENKRANLLMDYAYYYDLSIRAGKLEGASDLMPRVRGKKTEKNELRALELLTLVHESAGITNSDQLEDLTKTDLEEMATESVYIASGLNAEQAQQVTQYLRHAGVDSVKFAMWIHTSARSQKLQTYLGEFLQFIAADNSLADWKFNHALGNNIPTEIPVDTRIAWKEEVSIPLATANLRGSIDFTNDLSAILLCGARPVNNCLHYAYGTNQRALVGLLNADTKLVNITNHNGNPIGNAVLRLGLDKGSPVALLEPLYSSESDDFKRRELHHTLIAAAEEYVKSIGLPLRIAYVRDHGAEMRRAAFCVWSTDRLLSSSVLLAPSLAPFTYVDNNGVSTKRIFSSAESA